MSLVIGLLFDKFGSDAFIYNFLAGLFIGLSVPLNICGIYKVSRSIKPVKEV